MFGPRCAVLVALIAVLVGLLPLAISYHLGGWVRLYTHNPAGFSFDDIPDLSGRVAIVTGGNTGIGKVTARELARRGAHVVIGARTEHKGVEAVEDILQDVGADKKVKFVPLDLASFASIRAFADKFKQQNLPLHILVLNAGVMMCPYAQTEDGLELQIGTNHVGHHLLVRLLEDKLVASAPSRVVVVTSKAHESPYEPEGIRFDQFRSDKGYDAHDAYGQSKLANVLMANHLARRLAAKGVLINSCHPGIIATELARHLKDQLNSLSYGWAIRIFLEAFVGPAMFSADDGALTQLYLATHPDIETERITGQYFEPVAFMTNCSAHGQNVTLQKKLWKFTEKLLPA